MIYTLTVMMCLGVGPGAECRYFWKDFDSPKASKEDCVAMKNEFILDARREGFRVMAFCSPLARDVSK